MRKRTPFVVEVSLGLVLTLGVAWSLSKRTTALETLSLSTYDFFSRLRPRAPKTDAIRLVEIDDASLANLGRWPWPRSTTAQLVDDVVAAGAKVIGLNVLFTETDANPAVEEISHFHDRFAALLKEQRPSLTRHKVPTAGFDAFLEELASARDELNGDAALSESIDQATNVILPMYFQEGELLGEPEKSPAAFDREKIKHAEDAKGTVAPPANGFTLPITGLVKGAAATGHSNLMPDLDGRLRRIAPLMRYGDHYYPSFGLNVVRENLRVPRSAVTLEPGAVVVGKARIPLDEQGFTYLDFAGPAGTFSRHSAVDVLTNGLPEGSLANKIVLIGVTAAGAAQTYPGPSGETFTGLEMWATHISNILNQRFVVRPPWAKTAEWFFVVLAAVIVLFALPFLRARFSVPLAACAFAGIVGPSLFLFVKKGFWVSPAYGATLLVTGYLLVVASRLLLTERRKEFVEAEGVETNKMLGLSFQGQGMLDLAFEKFRRCPMDESMKELLYNLGLDMERKRQFSKAAAVYEHIAATDTGYKDINDKIALLKKAGEGAVFGTLGKKGNDTTVVVDGLKQNTTLGRYEVIKELGRGAMGIVYLGKDPKINRQVAIKTLRFEEDMDETQTKKVKDRFFREAESAGNLTHPNIIRIFDAGEDQDVAYIAMELLEGEDLKKYCEKPNLLPMTKVMEMIAQVASGLDYAHKQGVIHRDIKPSNIMLLKDGSLRITDFGIARLQTSSKTATGAVLGTPAYMSPEQVEGKKVDGRADIFSLGVTLFEMLTGEKPFYADTIPALLYRLANVDHPDPREFNPNLPAAIVPILNRALAKDPEQRYPTAQALADDIRACIKAIESGVATVAPLPPAPPPPAAPLPPMARSEATAATPSPIPELPSEIKAPTPPAAETKTEISPMPESSPSVGVTDSFLADLEAAFTSPSPAEPPPPPPAAPPAAEDRSPHDFLNDLENAELADLLKPATPAPVTAPAPASLAPSELAGPATPAIENGHTPEPEAPPLFDGALAKEPDSTESPAAPFKILKSDEPDAQANNPFASISEPIAPATSSSTESKPAAPPAAAFTEHDFLSELQQTFNISHNSGSSPKAVTPEAPLLESGPAATLNDGFRILPALNDDKPAPSDLPAPSGEPAPATTLSDVALPEPALPNVLLPDPPVARPVSPDMAFAVEAPVSPENEAEKTVVIPPPSSDVEKTVAWEPASKDVPLAEGIEPSFQPPIPQTLSEKDLPARKAGGSPPSPL